MRAIINFLCLTFFFGLLSLSCCAKSHEMRNMATPSPNKIHNNNVKGKISQADEDKLKSDSLLVDSMVTMMWESFKCIDESRIQIIKNYVFSCSNEDASEGIADGFGKAFVEDDIFFKQILSLYDSLENEDQKKFKNWLVDCLYFYIDTWAAQNSLSLNPSHEYEDWILSFQNQHISRIIALRDNIRQNNFKLIYRFCN